MKRLSIIDLETGHQPMLNEDGSIALVFNGAIYNYRELRKSLESSHSFKSRSDTEVILHLYEEYGVECLQKLRGMFAFAIWDSRKQRLFAARDRLGQKPFYYIQFNGSFYFASEINALLKIPGFPKKININAVHHYLTYQYIPSPMTIWQDVRRLQPASYLLLDRRGQITSRRYWDISFKTKTQLDFRGAKDRIAELLQESTRMRMIADVPVGSFLSGGIDSSIVTALMSGLSSEPVKTFSIGFKDDDFSELTYARMIAERYRTEHHEFVVEPEYIDILPDIVRSHGQPYADASALPSYYLAKMARQHVKVALNGDAGDENFAGYLRHKALKYSQYLSPPARLIPGSLLNLAGKAVPGRKMNKYITRLIEPLKESPAMRNLTWHAYFTNSLKDMVYSEEMKAQTAGNDAYAYLLSIFENAPADTVLDRSLYADLTAYLPESLAVKMDIATMSNSLETRSPFLDHKLIEFCATLPDSWKIRGGTGKYILKETFSDLLPPEIRRRGKMGFGIPVGNWFRSGLKDYLCETVLSKKAEARGYFNFANLRKLVYNHIEGKADHSNPLWALLMLELWHCEFIDKAL